MILTAMDIRITIKNPHCVPEKGIPEAFRFIPYALNTIVGMLITIVMIDSTFITSFRLFEITDAKMSTMLLRIPLYIFAISIA